MSARLRLAAVLVAVVALVAGLVAALLGGIAPSGGSSTAAPAPVLVPTPTDLTAGLIVPAGVEVSTARLTQDGLSRSYLVLASATVAPGTPLLIGLHGRNATPAGEAQRDELLPYVAAGSAVLVYPAAYDEAWNVDDGCCGAAVEVGLDDVVFVGQVVDAVRARLGLTGPTDLVGFSNGARLAYDVICRDPSRYAAIATIAGVPTTPTCQNDSVVVPLFAGVTLDDTELPTHEQPTSAASALAKLTSGWLTRDQCVGAPTTTTGGQATVQVWTACAAGGTVETVTWPSGGHIWPQEGDVGSPDAADLVWSFLSGVRQRAITT